MSTGPEQPPRGPAHSAIAAAEPSPMASARNAFRKGCVGGLLTHVKGEPVMLLVRPDWKGRAFAIQKSRIHLYVDADAGAPTLLLASKAQEIAKHLGIDPLNVNINDIMDMVIFHADDLLKMESQQ